MFESLPPEIATALFNYGYSLIILEIGLAVLSIIWIIRINRAVRKEVDMAGQDKCKIFRFGLFFRIAEPLFIIFLVIFAYQKFPEYKWNPNAGLTPESIYLTLLLLMGSLATASWMLFLYVFGTQALISESKLVKFSPFGRKKSIDWKEIDYVTYSYIWSSWIFVSANQKIRVNDKMNGFFSSEAKGHAPSNRWCPPDKMPKHRWWYIFWGE
jgi:hypothetical protein